MWARPVSVRDTTMGLRIGSLVKVQGGAVALFLGLSAPVLAAVPEFPVGCEPFLTVQTLACEVDIYLRCETADGREVRVQNYGAEGLDSIEALDGDGSLKFSIDPAGQSGIVVRTGPAEPLSRKAMLKDGVSRFVYPVDFYYRGPDPEPAELTGEFRMTGQEVEIDGHVLKLLENRMTVALAPPRGPIETIQVGYYSPEFDVVMEGSGSLRVGDAVQQVRNGPAAFFGPGESGFLSVAPMFNCEAESL